MAAAVTQVPALNSAVRARPLPARGLDRTLRVMHVVYSLQPGGMEHGVVKLVNGLDPSRIESAVCATKPGGTLTSAVSPTVPVFELNRRAGNDPRLVRDLYRLFRRIRPDIVHTHAWGTLIEGLVAARVAGVPAVVHGEHGTLQLKAHQRWVQRRAWSAADCVLSVSTRLAERIARETGFPVARIRTIRNGVNLSRFGRIERVAARRQLGLDAGARVAIAVGRLVPVKDHMTLLDAVAALRQEGLETTLAIAGDGPLKQALVERCAALGMAGAVKFLGHRTDVETVLAAADVFAISSTSEGLSNTILEAMAAGLPVVATRVGGADEMVEDGCTGLLVEASSVPALAAGLRRVLGDQDAGRVMGLAGRARAQAEFSLEGMVGRYESMYLEMAAMKTAARKGRRSAPASIERSGVA
jgi:sugar transferase (PEP-CTERM/EpsH1 system associated)